LKLIIEVDGEPHQTDEGRQGDQRRDQCLVEHGYHVVRIPGYAEKGDIVRFKRSGLSCDPISGLD
jgi:very-short-patch-repair endonuclease